MKYLSGILLLISCSLWAQYNKGTIKRNNGSEKSGLIELDSNEGINYKESQDSEIQAISADDISIIDITVDDEALHYVYYTAEFFTSKNGSTKKRRRFKVLKDGKMMFLEYDPDAEVSIMYVDLTLRYVKRQSEDTATYFSHKQGIFASNDNFTRQGFKKFASDYFSDCPALLEKIKNKDFKPKQGAEIVDFYNTQCQ